MDRDKLFQELWGKSGGRCMYCGRPLHKGEAVIEHIFPRSCGGSDRMENLVLICRDCNSMKGNRPFFNEASFERHLFQLLAEDPRFENVRMDERMEIEDGQKVSFDLLFTRKNDEKQELYIIEAKNVPAVTEELVASVTCQLEYYRRFYPLAHYILAVPVPVAEQYRQRIHEAGFALWDSEILSAGIPPDDVQPTDTERDQYDEWMEKLEQCAPGYQNWQIYQKLIGEILSVLFCPPLDGVSEQNSDANRTNRRDYVMPNYADSGPWQYLRQRYNAEFIIADAKNSARKIGKSDILQVAHYLKSKGSGMFGLIFSRYGMNKNAVWHLQDIWKNEDKMIVVLDDNDVVQMLLAKRAGQDPCQLIMTKIQEFRLNI